MNSIPINDDDPFDHEGEEEVNNKTKESCNPHPEVLQTHSFEVVTFNPAPYSIQSI
jgi:hypothetical protein